MSIFGHKLRRVAEAADLATRNAADWSSRRVLASMYWVSTVGDANRMNEEVTLRWRVGLSVFPVRVRRADVYTFAEIFHERQVALTTRVPSAPFVVDAGANVGLATLWFLGTYPGSRVVCFEPAPENVRLLRANVEPTGRASVVPAAVGRTSGFITLHLAEHDAMHSTVSAPETHPGQSLQVPLVALRDYLSEHAIERIDILKLDVEGAELEALEGLGDRIANVGVMVGEVHERAVSEDAFYTFLRAHGFVNIRKTSFASGRGLGVHGFEAARAP